MLSDVRVIKNERGITISEDRPVKLNNCHDVTIKGCDIKTTGDGIYVNNNCTGIQIVGNKVQADHVGIYLDRGSNNNLVKDNIIKNCGHYAAFNGARIPRLGIFKREAIAIDDSRDNVIEDNLIKNPALAGIILYRNCGEYGANPIGEGANRNLICNNKITDTKVGIWVESRRWRDLSAWECSRPGKWIPLTTVPKEQMPYQQLVSWTAIAFSFERGKFYNPFKPMIYIVPDSAQDNVIRGNTYKNVKHEVIL